MDDAAGGQRGTRAVVSADLEGFLRANWGVWPAGPAPDLGGSSNLNLLVTDGRSLQVARVYRPFVTAQRVAALQAVRHHLASHGVPCAEPIPAAGGRGWETFEGRAVEAESYVATIVLRVRLTGGDRMDITYEEPDVANEGELIEHVISTFAQDSGVLRSKHGDRLVVLYSRGVAAIEVAPRGAVL